MNFNKVKAIIFDLDGVLVLSGPVHEKAFLAVLKNYGASDFNYSNYLGMRTDEVIRDFLKEKGIDYTEEELDEIVRKKRKLANESLSREVPIVAGCTELIEYLYEKKYFLAIATSSSRNNLNNFTDKSKLKRFFSFSLCGEDVSLGKPDPEIFSTIIKKLGIQPEDALVIEDSISGIKAASAAGSCSIGVLTGKSKSELLGAGAKIAIESIMELRTIL